ncbi:MAG: HD-GYP domain-containing protein, partial [Butyrivibrio sp.]|nr:HD-GYP domain-containing protein [Butyrivibrio sp.]
MYETKYLLVFLQNIVDSYLHTDVKLNNGERAEIILINRQRGSKPVVMTTGGKPVDLSKEPGLRIEQVYD